MSAPRPLPDGRPGRRGLVGVEVTPDDEIERLRSELADMTALVREMWDTEVLRCWCPDCRPQSLMASGGAAQRAARRLDRGGPE